MHIQVYKNLQVPVKEKISKSIEEQMKNKIKESIANHRTIKAYCIDIKHLLIRLASGCCNLHLMVEGDSLCAVTWASGYCNTLGD